MRLFASLQLHEVYLIFERGIMAIQRESSFA